MIYLIDARALTVLFIYLIRWMRRHVKLLVGWVFGNDLLFLHSAMSSRYILPVTIGADQFEKLANCKSSEKRKQKKRNSKHRNRVAHLRTWSCENASQQLPHDSLPLHRMAEKWENENPTSFASHLSISKFSNNFKRRNWTFQSNWTYALQSTVLNTLTFMICSFTNW